MNILYDYAMSFVGLPYKWGGDNALTGFDCSGLVQEILASAGVDPRGDQTAQELFDHFKHGQWNVHALGSLAFYGKDAASITHVAFMIDPYRVIEAGGGDSTTTTRSVAEEKNATVRMRHISHRRDLIAIIRPDYSKIGVAR
jgi:cell wall-associated NlpC family hydrolase